MNFKGYTMANDEQLQKDAIEFEQLRNQLQNLAAQKQQSNMQILSLRQAIDAIKETKEKKVLKNVGPILIAAPAADVEKELSERIEGLELRIKTWAAQEQTVTTKLNKLKSSIESELRKRQANASTETATGA